MTDWVGIAALGVLEGVTEFLPVSSTGHLLLVEHSMGLSFKPSELFNVLIQDGAVLAVLLVFAQRLRQMALEWRTPAVRDYLFKLGVAFLITSVGGLILKQLGLKLSDQDPVPVAWATLVGGVAILGIERWLKGRNSSAEITWAVAVAVGLAQVLAAGFPGTSRSGACIIFALALGLNRPVATEFSFLVGVPTLLAAGGYSLVSAVRQGEQTIEPWYYIAGGTAIATVTAFVVVKWLLHFVQSHTFNVFGWYRILLGGVILFFFYWPK